LRTDTSNKVYLKTTAGQTDENIFAQLSWSKQSGRSISFVFHNLWKVAVKQHFTVPQWAGDQAGIDWNASYQLVDMLTEQKLSSCRKGSEIRSDFYVEMGPNTRMQWFRLEPCNSTSPSPWAEPSDAFAGTTPDWKRTVVFIKGQTAPGQDMFIRGGIDHGVSASLRHVTCSDGFGTQNYKCAIPIRFRNIKNPTAGMWKPGDSVLDWYGQEPGQIGMTHGMLAEGSALDWTTNNWPDTWRNKHTVAINGFGEDPLNKWGDHY